MRSGFVKTLVVGLTGGIVSGKSTVAGIFEKLGAKVIDADKIARSIVCPGETSWEKIVQFFGKEILQDNQEINRKKLAGIVFSDKNKLEQLNKITHPTIIAIIKEKIAQFKDMPGDKTQICIVDVPLLFEAELEKMMDRIIVVYIEQDKQIDRLMTRNNLNREDALNRIKAQMPVKEKISRSDYVIDNNKDIAFTEEQVKQIWHELLQLLDRIE